MSKWAYFNNEWLKDKKYSSWLQPGSTQSTFYCTMCKKETNLSNMGISALNSHIKSKKHVKVTASKTTQSSIFSSFASSSNTQKSTTSASPAPKSPASSAPPILPIFDISKRVNAETIWVLHCISNNISDRSNDDISEVFQAMFPGSPKLQLKRDKIRYVTNFGLAPYFRDILREDVNNSEYITVSYDESLNKIN